MENVIEQSNLQEIQVEPVSEPVKKKRTLSIVLYTLFSLLIIIILGFFISYTFLFRPFQMAGNGMYPTYHDGEYLLTETFAHTFQRGDIVIFAGPNNEGKYFNQRIIGMPGDTITVIDGDVYIDNKILDEHSYLAKDIKTFSGPFLQEDKSVTVPPDDYITLGDNRPFSADSRDWGFVPKKNIIGKVLFCYFNCSEKKAN